MGVPATRELNEVTASTQTRKTVAAIFQNEHEARTAIRELHELGFKHAWIGTVRAGETFEHLPLVDSADGGGVFEAIGRMFGGEGDRSLQNVLTSRGIWTEQAQDIVQRVEPGNAVVMVEADEQLPRVIETLETFGGDTGRPAGLRTDRDGPMYDSSAVFL